MVAHGSGTDRALAGSDLARLACWDLAYRGSFLQSVEVCDLAVLWKTWSLPFTHARDCPGQARGTKNGSDILPLNVQVGHGAVSGVSTLGDHVAGYYIVSRRDSQTSPAEMCVEEV
jgi:hypothetical protein